MFSSFSKIFFGWLCDYIKAKYAFILGVTFEAVGTFSLIHLKPESSKAFLGVFVFFMGMGAGSWLPVMSMAVSRNFSIKSYGTLFGIVNFGLSIGVATGPLVAAYIFDIQGSYYWAFNMFLIFYALAIILTLFGKANDKAYQYFKI